MLNGYVRYQIDGAAHELSSGLQVCDGSTSTCSLLGVRHLVECDSALVE
jgi:hypothetical protein